MTEQKESTSGKPQEIPRRTYYDPEREAIEQRIRRELSVKQKAGESWRNRHNEEIIGLLRDPGTPPATKQLLLDYVNDWEQFDQVEDEIADNEKDISKARDKKEPLLVVKYQQYKEILEENRRLRINRLTKEKKILEGSKIFPQGIELIPEKEYRDLGTGKVLGGTDSVMAELEKKGNERMEKKANEHPEDSATAQPPPDQ